MISIFVENLERDTIRARSTTVPDQNLDVIESWRLKEEENEQLAFLKYIKTDDVETCINTLFVLTNSKPERLNHLMSCFKVGKKEFIDMMIIVLKSNIDEHKESLKYLMKNTLNMVPSHLYDKFAPTRQ